MSLALLLTIALGAGSNAAVHGFARGLVVRDLPLPDADALASIFAQDAQRAFGPLSYDRYVSLKEQRETFEVLGAAREIQNSIVIGGRTTVMSVAAVTPELDDVLQLSLGTGVVISHRVWRTEFGARADLRGERIRIDGIDKEVAAVAPEWLEGLYVGRAVDVWMRLPDASPDGIDRRSRTVWVLGRLRPGVSARQAQITLNADPSAADATAVFPYTGLTPEAAGAMWRVTTLLRAAAAAVFLIACANITSFLLARASSRSHETAVRIALGAGRGRLAGQLLSDSMLISVFGGAAGIVLAVWTAQIVPALFFDQDAENLVFSIDLTGIVAAAAVCAGITIACGLIPLLETRDDDPATVLQRQSLGPSIAPRRLRKGLVVAQMTCCCVLVISTGLLFDGFRTALQTAGAHHLGRPVLATLEASGRFERPDLGRKLFAQAEVAARSLPGVSSTAWVSSPPGNRPAWRAVRIEPPQLSVRDVIMDVVLFTPRSLEQIRLPPIAGRMFSAQACKVAVVNETAAIDLFEGDAVGRSILDAWGQRVEIIGVVATAQPAKNRRARARPTIYYDAEQKSTSADHVGPAHFRVPVRSKPASAVVATNVVSPEYFGAMDLLTVGGSTILTGASCHAGVINEEAAELYFGGNAVGGAFHDSSGQRIEIVGVVRSPPLRAWQRRAEPVLYLPMSENYLPRMTLILGTEPGGAATVAAVQRRLEAASAGLGRATVTTLDAHLGRTALAPERIATMLVGAFTATALVLGAVGVYAAMAESTRQRRREIALRLALGARRRHVIRQVTAEALRLAAVGTVSGMIGSVLVAPWLTRITPSVVSLAPWVWAVAPLVLIGVVIAASVFPARRALTVNPVTIMQET